MGLRIQHNIPAMNAHRMLSISDAGLSKSLERLSSGYRINRAADDAAGLAISQSFRADIASFNVASRNTSEAAALLQVGEGAMDQIGNMMTRLKELATQAASANAGNDLDKIDAERAALILEIDRIANVTEYAGSKLIDGTFGNLPYEFGDAAGDTLDLETKYGNEWKYVDNGSNTPTANFTFSSDVKDLAAGTYTLNTIGSSLTAGVELTDGTDTYHGVYDSTNQALTFSTLGMTITYDSALLASVASADTITVKDVGFSTMEIGSSMDVGRWQISDVAGTITLTNTTTSDVLSVSGVVSGVEQTLDFDLATLKLSAEYTQGELNLHEFVVIAGGANTFQVGSANSSNDRISISLGDATVSGLGLGGISFLTAADAQSALDTIDAAIASLVSVRGGVGAAQNRLGYAAANLATTIENVQAAESVIRDVDMAAEMTTFTKNQILLQAGTAMLAQANMAPQVVLQLMG